VKGVRNIKNKFSITMPPELTETADILAKQMGMNRISFINLCVAAYIENRKIAMTVDSLRDSMIEKMNIEFENLVKSTVNVVDKSKVIKG